MTSTWNKVHQPCPICNSSDAVGVNEDGSAKCFSCDTFMPNYKDACEGKNMEVKKDNAFKQPDDVSLGSFSALTDRKYLKTLLKSMELKLSMIYRVKL